MRNQTLNSCSALIAVLALALVAFAGGCQFETELDPAELEQVEQEVVAKAIDFDIGDWEPYPAPNGWTPGPGECIQHCDSGACCKACYNGDVCDLWWDESGMWWRCYPASSCGGGGWADMSSSEDSRSIE